MRGDIVVCKDFVGKLLDRLLWEDAGRIIFIHTADQFAAHTAGRPHLEPVGFPEEDVFSRKGESGELEPYALSRQANSLNHE
jgi:hypothetical protein